MIGCSDDIPNRYSGTQILSGECTMCDARYQNLSNLNLSNSIYKGTYFYNSNLSNTDLSKSDLRSANFVLANLSQSNLSQTNIRNAVFTDASMFGSTLKGANGSMANSPFEG